MRRLGLVIPVMCGLALGCKDEGGGEIASVGDSSSSAGDVTGDEPTTAGTSPSGPGGTEGSASATASATDGTTDGTPGSTGPGDPTTGDPGPVVDWTFGNVFGRANLDDDDDNGQTDWLELPFDGDDELATLVLPGATLDALPPGSQVRLTLSGPGDTVRAWLGGQPILGSNQGAPLLEHVFTPPGGDVALQWEFGDHNAGADLTITWLDDQGAEVESFAAVVRASPLITNHHLQPTERVWVVDVKGGGGYNNQSMIQAMEAALGPGIVTRVPAGSYKGDVWIQDEFEWATARSGDGGRMDVVIDSIRNRGLDPLPEDTLVGPDYIAQTWGNPANKTTYDSFGNLDASPPVTVDGTSYPFGRIYYGRLGNEGLDSVLADYLAAQTIQKPFELDTTWLCVGHVDEFSGIVPDPDAPKGFRLLFADVPSMYAILDKLPQSTQLPRYGQDYGYPTVGSITSDNGLRAYNEDVQADHLDGLRERFKQELGLDDADIILVPTLFENISNCGSLTLVPGSVNFALFNVDGAPARMFVADPFLRPGGVAQDADPLIIDFKNRMPKTLEVHFVDNWNVYHVNFGEVHCGTNVQRTPLANWWEEN